MIDFDREWARSRRRHERAARLVTIGVIITWAATFAVLLLIGVVGFKIAKAGPEAIAAKAGHAVAAFERARDGR